MAIPILTTRINKVGSRINKVGPRINKGGPRINKGGPRINKVGRASYMCYALFKSKCWKLFIDKCRDVKLSTFQAGSYLSLAQPAACLGKQDKMPLIVPIVQF